MDHPDHVNLLRPALEGQPPGATWADIGAGGGAFTLALADLLGPGAHLIAIDRDRDSLARNSTAMKQRFPATDLRTLVADFTRPLDAPALGLPQLDGLVAANSLHYVPRAEQVETIGRLAGLLRPGATLVVVEYDSDSGNPWVPYPFAARRWVDLAGAAGLVGARIIGRVPSRFLGAIYSAAAQTSAD